MINILLTIALGLMIFTFYTIIFLGLQSLLEFISEMYNEYIFNHFGEWPGFNYHHYVLWLILGLLALHFLYIIGSFYK